MINKVHVKSLDKDGIISALDKYNQDKALYCINIEGIGSYAWIKEEDLIC